MFGVTGILSSVDYRNTTQSFTDANNIVIFTINDIVDSDWQTISASYDSLIKARDHNYVDVATKTTFGNITGSFTTTINGAHKAEDYNAYAIPQISGSGFNNNVRRLGTSGNHAHSLTFSINSGSDNFPFHIKTRLYKRNPYSRKIFTLPIGTIVFGENILNNYGVVANSYFDNRYLCSSTISIGRLGGSNEFFSDVTIGSGGVHNHVGPATRSQTSYPGYGGGDYSGAVTYGNIGSHTHSGLILFNQYKKYVKLRTYKVQEENTFISPGMIFGFSSNNVSQGWYCCNGQIVAGYTTPNLVDRYIMCGNSDISSHNVKPDSIDDKNSISYVSYDLLIDTNDWNHTHGYGGVFQQLGASTEAFFHDSESISHQHTVSATPGPYTYESDHYNLIYYIYLP
jgi:hypothetical protein